MRPLRPACGTVSNAQLLTLPATISTSAPGVVTTQLSFLPPASSSATEVLGSSESRPATVLPPEPPPTTTKSNVSVTCVPPKSLLLVRDSGRSEGTGPGQSWPEAPLLRGFCQGRFPTSSPARKQAFLASQKPRNRTLWAFPKQVRVDTYAPH